MTNKWNGSILRKSNLQTIVVAPENESTRGADLLVFGYSCKIFRDDEKAQYIDQGKHLISMGDKSLKIDRYDVRAALSDLSKYEPPPGGYTNRLDCLTPAEQRAEQLCEEERYYSLYHNEQEEQMYQEEELKRLHLQGASSYGQVQFDYNRQQQKSHESGANEEKMEEVDEVFVVPHGLTVPANLPMPTTMKQHAIIEKTAKFISTQGPQMEILIKAKQSNNPQFEFLNQNNQLNPYYKFVLNSFKSGTYPEETAKAEQENRLLESKPAITDSNSRNSNSITDHSFTKPSTPIPIIKYRPSADCAYTQLISKIKGVPIPELPDELSIEASMPDYSSNYVVGQQQESKSALVVPKQSSSTEQRNQKVSETVEVKKISSGLMLAQCYASDTEDESDSFETEAIIIDPPEHLQTIIDKTAIYVAKNGKQFEEILRTKEDDRFEFLDPWNEFYPYYLHKVTNLNPNYRPTKRSDKTKAIAPVSFSIKSKDESSVPINPALLQETSDDENEHKSNAQNQTSDSNSAGGQNNQTADTIAIPTPNALLAAATAAKINAAIANAQNSNSSSAGSGHMATARSRFDIDNTGTIVSRNLAMNSLPIGKIEASQQKELKRAEEKVKDRLAQIAREKLGLISKEKQLQLERKKKAMAFLNQIKGSKLTVSSSTFVPRVAHFASKEDSVVRSESGTDTDTSSVHSIPITIDTNNENNHRNNEDNNVEEKHQKSWERLKPSEIPFDADEIKLDDDQKSSRETKRHRSRSKSSSHHHQHRHHKKKKSKHSKKKSKKRSHSRSPSSSPDREHKKSKRSSSRKSKKRRKEHD